MESVRRGAILLKSKIEVCEICGHKGKLKNLVTCPGCGISVKHWYCFDVYPKNDHEKLAWKCEDCALRLPNISPVACRKSERITKAAEIKLNRMEMWKQSGISPVKAKVQVDKLPKKKQPSNEESERVSSCDLKPKKEELIKPKRRLILEDEDEHEANMNQDSQLALIATEVPPILSYALPCGEAYVEEHAQPLTDPIRRSLEAKRLPDDGHEPTQCQPSQSALAVIEYPPSISRAILQIEGYMCDHARPVIDPIWRGCFRISNANIPTSVRIVAHLSSLACKKARDASIALPPHLDVELLLRTDIWPKSFRTLPPSDDSIALYFFQECGSDVNFDALVDDMISRDLAIKARIKDAELLVFSSRELPRRFWDFGGRLYLWGTYRSANQSSAAEYHSRGQKFLETGRSY